jgi:hypothetical protein
MRRHATRYLASIMANGSPHRYAALWVGLASLAVLGGCAPQAQYRHTAFVPAVHPIAFDGVTSPAGTLRIEGTLQWSDVAENFFPNLHDTAVRVPRWTAEGSAMLSVNAHVELGVRGSYADYAWSEDSAIGTMPLPTAPASTGYGPELHLSFPLSADHRFRLGLAGNLMLYDVPNAQWQLTGPGSSSGKPLCTPSLDCVGGYELVDTRSDSPLVYNVGAFPSYSFGPGGEYGHVLGVMDATSGFSNDGFSDMPANGSTLNGVGPIIILGLGYGFSREWGHVSGVVYHPLTDRSSPVDYGFGFQLSLGVNIDLWEATQP